MTTLSLADGLYQVESIGEIDNQLFNVYKDDELITTLGFGESGEWEATNQIDDALVKVLGEHIEAQFKNI